MVLFSVIIPVFNRASLIETTIVSVFNQSFTDWEIIVVDDGSTDGTHDVLIQYSDKIKVFYQQNHGPGAARNLGINYAQGKYIVFLDSDDIWFPWTLSIFNEVIQANNYPSFIVGESVFFSNELEIQNIYSSTAKFNYYVDYYKYSHHSLQPFIGAVAIHRITLQQVGNFTDQWINSEDNDLWLKLGICDGFVYIQSPVILAYRQHESSAIANINKTFQGTCYLIQQEKEGMYPGGNNRQIERLNILTRHIRPVSLACLHHVAIQQAWVLYKKSFLWHIRLLRVKYLLIFPLLLCFAVLRESWVIKLRATQ